MALKPLFKKPIGSLKDSSGNTMENSENNPRTLVCELCGDKISEKEFEKTLSIRYSVFFASNGNK